MSRRKCKVRIGRSKIHGVGVFATHVIKRGEVVNVNKIRFRRAYGGINHSCDPNVVLAYIEKELYVIATSDIARREELTTWYRKLHAPRCNCPKHRRRK